MFDQFDYLSESEQREIEKFLENTVMKEAVRKVILSGVYFEGRLEKDKPADPLKNFILGTMTQQATMMLPDADYGQRLRSMVNGISMVESGFEQLEKYKKVETQEEKKVNKAR